MRDKGFSIPNFRPKINTGRNFTKPKPRHPPKELYGDDWQTLSAYVRKRDGYRCQINKLDITKTCHGYYPPPFTGLLHAHHVIPLPRGSNHPTNLVALCVECHGRLHNKNLGKITAKQKRAASRL